MAQSLRRLIPWLVMLVGCTSQPFCSYKDSAPVYVMPVPDGRASSFGRVMAAIEMDLNDVAGPASYVAASGGPATATEVYRVDDGEGLSVARHDTLLDICVVEDRDNDQTDCFERGPGSALAYRSRWRDRTECLAVGFAGDSRDPGVGFWCGVGGAAHPDELVEGQSHTTFYVPLEEAVRSLETVRAPTERLFIGTDAGLHVLEIDSIDPARVTWDDNDEMPTSSRPDIYAMSSLESTEVASGFLLALGLAEDELVIIGEYVPASGEDGPTLIPRACVARAQPGFGSVAQLARLTPDGDPVLVASANMEWVDREPAVQIYELTLAEDPTTVTCAEATPTHTLACAETVGDNGETVNVGADCDVEGSLFGAAFDIGNIDDTAAAEIVVGSPGARVNGYDRAGAAYVFRPALNGATPLAVLADAAATDGLFEEDRRDYRFGDGVLLVPVAGRDEVLISSPGGGSPALMLHLCTGVGQAAPAWDNPRNATGSLEDARCQDN